MTDTKENKQNSQQAADGVFEEKHGNTTYKVKVYFNHDGQMTAEDSLKRVIMADTSAKVG